MTHVLARALPDRLAYSAPVGGKAITPAEWVLVRKSAWIDKRAADGDIEIKELTSTAAVVASNPNADPVEEAAEAKRTKSAAPKAV